MFIIGAPVIVGKQTRCAISNLLQIHTHKLYYACIWNLQMSLRLFSKGSVAVQVVIIRPYPNHFLNIVIWQIYIFHQKMFFWISFLSFNWQALQTKIKLQTWKCLKLQTSLSLAFLISCIAQFTIVELKISLCV